MFTPFGMILPLSMNPADLDTTQGLESLPLKSLHVLPFLLFSSCLAFPLLSSLRPRPTGSSRPNGVFFFLLFSLFLQAHHEVYFVVTVSNKFQRIVNTVTSILGPSHTNVKCLPLFYPCFYIRVIYSCFSIPFFFFFAVRERESSAGTRIPELGPQQCGVCRGTGAM